MLKNLAFLVLVSLLASCTPGNPANYDVELNFKVIANNTEVDLNTPSNHTNDQGQTYTVSKFQMLISDIFLTSTPGLLGAKHSEVELPPNDKRIKEYHYLDLSDSSTLSLSLKNLDEVDGRFSYITFRFGLTQNDNQTNALPNEANYNNFSWPAMMGGGYHYMKFEGSQNVTPSTFAMHAGPTGGNDYSFTVSLPIQQYVKDKKLTLTVLIDLNEFFSNDFNFPISGIMGNATAQQAIKANGPNVFSLE